MFPWESYHDGPNALPFTVDITNPSEPRARSKHCHSDTFEGSPCCECAIVHKHISRLVEIARDPKAHTNYKYLGLAHMQDIAKMYAAQVKELKLQACNDSRKHMTSLTQLDDYNRLLMAISENDVPRLQQVIKIALDNGASVREVVNKLEDAIEGVYRPRGYGSSDIDIATLVYRLGGRQLLYALNHQIGIPSIRTLRARATFTTIMPTIGPIRPEQFDENIRNIILNTRDDTASLRGVSFMIDELALEEMAIHFGKYNMIGGLCWKHSNLVDPVLRTYDSAVRIAQKIHTQEVHLGKEVTVIGVACFGEDELYPVLAAPTCKTENAADMEGVLTRAIERWSATGANTRVGPVWSFATDGDATRRAAGHRLFVKKPLSSDSPLYATLSDMPGLNTLTGDNEVTLDFDFKHIFKRICTLIRSPAGITLNNGRIINAMMLSRYLLWLPAHDEASVTKLLHPDDPQDVPRAIELMQAIITFSKLQHDSIDSSFSTNIDIRADLAAIKLLGDLIESILLPFVDTNLSLTQQVQCLSCYAHLSFAIFRSHRRAFMPYQLYYDTQTMTKNIVFCIRKQQVLDPREKFFIGDSGDDRLELHFGRTQMIGGHNSGCSYSQVLDRLGAAKDIDGVFKRHPEIDPGHRRLKMGTRHETVDHINREMWRGDIVSGRCDLPSAWQMGCDMALSILTRSQIDPINFSFPTLFSDPAVDMLRPFGMNKYLGISDADEDPEDASVPPNPVAPQILDVPSLPLPYPDITHTDVDDESAELTFEEALIAQADADIPSTPLHQVQPDPSAPPLPGGPGVRPEDYVLFKNRWIHKQTVCRLVINKDFISKSCNRLERVRAGYTKVNKRIDMSAGRITDGNLFLVGDIFLTLIRSGRTVSLGILHSSPTSLHFLWNGGYVKSHSTIQGTSDSTERVVVVSVPGSLVEPINPEPTFIRLRDDINSDDFVEIKGGQSTWQVSQGALEAACGLLWEKSLETSVPPKSMVSVTPSDTKTFPYQLADGMSFF
ncbi:hypothetical protein CY34DRAFT_23175 [Suillus luteus UH-Slu-Lm8-n1]|uniref:Uncharacterized protein n=1 Tax=Suillus luteus UH-Slu-Lm8-n1 TaxID=930992 RepID=A0A0D0A2N4_9AGAM|nr:hypothetical protein CY34DRAFT_23175 [Suillus luteus UH-Slu-Lm8-n1]